MKKIAAYFLAGCLALSCIYPYEAELDSIEGALVIEGDILLGNVSSFRLSYVQPLDEAFGIGSTVPGVVWVEDDKGGIYRSDGSEKNQVDMTDAPADRQYRLHVSIPKTGKNYVSEWRAPQMAPIIEDISFEIGETDNPILRRPDGKARLSMRAADGASRYFRWDYEEEWLFHAMYYIRYFFDPETREYSPETDGDPTYWCWTKTSSTEAQIAIAIGDEQNRIQDHVFMNFNTGTDTRCVRKYGVHIIARGISEECYQYLHTLEMNSNSSGDLFTPNPSELRGNILCEEDPDELVLGFVEVSRTSDRFSFLPDDIGAYLDRGDSDLQKLVEPPAAELADFYARGWRPIDYVTPDEGAPFMGWARPEWCDCRAAGGTKIRPPYWED